MDIKYRPDIDGLRAFAVIAVIIYHLNSHWLQGGFIGVDIFFVISGYLITKIIYTEICQNQFSFKRFYHRRINRILPNFFFIMFCTGIASWLVLLPDEFTSFLSSLQTTTYFWQNMYFANNTGGYWDVSAEQMPILHTWSLAVEEQFYILLPFLLLLLSCIRFKINKHIFYFKSQHILIILLIIAVTSFCLAQFSSKSIVLTKYNYYSLFTGRAAELLMGSIIGILSYYYDKTKSYLIVDSKNSFFIVNNILSLLGFIAIIFSIISISKNSLFPGFITLMPTLGAVLIIFFYDSQTYVAKLLSLKPIVFIGKISFSLYLWHWPIIVLARKYLFVDNFETALQYLTVIVLTLLASGLTYYLIETPCRKYKKSFKFSFIFYYLIPVILIIGIYQTQKKTHFLDFKFNERLALYNLQKQNGWENNSANYCYSNINGECLFGDVTQKPQMILVGDSHSGHLFRYFDQAGKLYGFSIRMVEAGGCSFLKEQDNVIESCKNIIQGSKQWLADAKVIFYILRYNQFETLLSNYFEGFLTNLLNNHKKVILLKDVPELKNDQEVDKYYKHYLTGLQSPINDILSDDNSGNQLMERIAEKYNIPFFNPLDGLTDEQQQQWPLYRGLLAYSDSNHLNLYTSEEFPKQVLPKQKDFWHDILQLIHE